MFLSIFDPRALTYFIIWGDIVIYINTFSTLIKGLKKICSPCRSLSSPPSFLDPKNIRVLQSQSDGVCASGVNFDTDLKATLFLMLKSD